MWRGLDWQRQARVEACGMPQTLTPIPWIIHVSNVPPKKEKRLTKPFSFDQFRSPLSDSESQHVKCGASGPGKWHRILWY